MTWGVMGQCVKAYCKHFEEPEAPLTKRAVPTPVLGNKVSTVHKCQGHSDRCGALCCSGNFADVREAEKKRSTMSKGIQVLHWLAARVLMTAPYAAKMARPDLLKAVCSLASHVNRWADADTARIIA